MIEPFKTSIDPLCIPHSEQYNLFVLAKIENGKVQAMKMDTSKVSIRKIEAFQLPKIEATLENIAEAVSTYFKVTVDDMKGRCREGDIMKARLIFCAIAKLKSNCSLAKIGAFVNRSHCTVLNANNSVHQLGKKADGSLSLYEHYLIINERFE